MIGLLTTGRHDLAYLTPLREALPGSVWIDAAPAQVASDDVEAARLASRAIQSLCLQAEGRRLTRLVVLGDRTETLAVCVAATCMKIPIAHIHGGEVTLGAVDNVCRNAISQLAGLHFCAHELAAGRLRAMNVPGDILISGSPAIDLLKRKPRTRLPGPDVVMSYHPETLSDVPPLEQIQKALNVARSHVRLGGVITYCGSNPDAGGAQINEFMQRQPDVWFCSDMTPDEYWDLLCRSQCLVGNSSSGVIECPALGVPWIEVGDRQKGRDRCSYGDGKATGRIVAALLATATA